MVGWRHACAVGLAAIAILASDVGALGAEPTERLVIDLTELDESGLSAALRAAGGTLVRIDHDLGFAVVEAAPNALRRQVGDLLIRDARGGGGVGAGPADVPADPLYAGQWGANRLDMPLAWGIQPGRTSVVVAVVDSGIARSHPDFSGTPIVLGSDYVNGGLPDDEHGHGTQVAGIIAATRDNAQGVAGIGKATLLVIRVLDRNNAGWCSDFASGVNEAVTRGAKIINLSLWCSVDYGPLRQAVQTAQDKGVLVVGITGNEWQSAPQRCVTYPGRYAAVMAVAATDVFDAAASFSCRGPQTEIAAPGVDIVSTARDGSYAWGSGTSFAAPHVSGAAALLAAQDPSRSGSALRAILTSTAEDLGAPGRDTEYGFGLVDAVAALR